MNDHVLLLPILIPLVAGVITLLLRPREAIALAATAFTLVLAVFLYNHDKTFSVAWAGFGMEFLLRLYHFSSFILLAATGFSLLVVLYCCSFMRDSKHPNQFYSYLLITLAFVNGAVLADNLVLMLFFWEGLLVTLFGMIALGGREGFKTATKALIIVGISDLCLMVGIGLAGHLAGTATMSKMSLPMTPLASLAFVFMMIGAISKAGSMPFHTWIPDAAVSAPLPFMAFLPASLEKLLGIYLLARISLDLFQLSAGSWISVTMMIIGSLTILLAVMMALVQKDYKKLLSYHAISQVGYMVLGIGTCVPIGIGGGLFHMINHALYKSCLFLTGGSVEKQTGTTRLEDLGGLARKMPVTFACFVIAACAISGVPPLNGFFSKELVYAGALERGSIYYIAAVLGSFFTAASFLKLGHAAYFGKQTEASKNVKEAPWPMLVPMIVIASICVLFGLYHQLPLNEFIRPILGEQRLAAQESSGNEMLIIVTVIVLALALLHHLVAAKTMGGGLHASDHIRHAPVLTKIYDHADKGRLDPYNLALAIIRGISNLAYRFDRAVDSLYNGLSVRLAYTLSRGISLAHTGNYSLYVVWALLGVAMVLAFMRMSLWQG
ncbi:MAG: proton-conducting transporter membrane subunit [Phycisphaerae bacterium]|nr:proton-conducting transporter membrane subunit [Phycisphaerae bacterium]